MASWDMLSRPKDQGGLGIINTKIMNECLLTKWIWKIFKQPDEVWYKLLKAKYMRHKSFFNSKSRGASQFWQGLHKVKHLFKWGAIHKVRDGSQTFFWLDTWLGDSPLKIQYPTLYSISRDPNAMVADIYYGGEWTIDFRRSLSSTEALEHDHLLSLLQTFHINSSECDEVEWSLDKSKGFSTKSLYTFITHRGVCMRNSDNFWRTKLPLKIKVFIWQLSHNCSRVLLSNIEVGKVTLPAVYVADKNLPLIFFSCSLARFVWSGLGSAFSWDKIPTCLDDLQRGKLSRMFGTNMRIGFFFFAGFAWAIWKARNKMAIERSFPNNPIDIIYTGLSFVQNWGRLLKSSDQDKLMKRVEVLKL